MKNLLLILIPLFLASATICYGASMLEKDANLNIIQGFAPNGTLSQALSVASTTIDLSNDTAFAVYPGAGTECKVRLMPTSAKGAYVQSTIPASMRTIFWKSAATPFANFSGCTSGELMRQAR